MLAPLLVRALPMPALRLPLALARTLLQLLVRALLLPPLPLARVLRPARALPLALRLLSSSKG